MASLPLNPVRGLSYDQHVELFWLKVDKTESCWLWKGHKQALGYGDVRFMGRRYLAHRLAWLLTNGSLPATGLCHHCDNPSCVRPDHLFPGDQKANMQDASRKGRIPHTPRTFKLSYDLADEIRRLYATGEYSMRALAARFGLKQHTSIRLIIANKYWVRSRGQNETP